MSAAHKQPTQLGKYRVVGVLGQGAMGVVYRAHDSGIDREVAVKTIHRELLSSTAASTMVERFRREAVAAGRLSHPGIVAVYDYGEESDVAFIVMELAAGVPLDDYVRARGPLPLDEVGVVMGQILDALGYAHERGVVHRDIKPSNVIVAAGGRVKITDFGIARLQSSTLTHTGISVGTPSHMAPEQYMGTAVDHRVDLFAAGVVLYELLTGHSPFGGETIESLAYQICHAPHAPPTQRRPSLPARLDAVVATALAKAADARYASAAEFSRGLAAALADARTSSSPGLRPDVSLAATIIASLPTPSGATSTSAPTTIAQPEIDRVTAELARHIGPIARVLVKRSLPKVHDLRALCLLVAQEIEKAPERAKFLKAMKVE